MKKSFQSEVNFIKSSNTDSNLVTDKKKTTNVNILLNRVKLDRKKDFKKKVIFSSLLALVVCLTSFFAMV
jgi:predicted secreted Zn-dependent protease